MEREVEILVVEDNINDAELTLRALRKNKITDKLHRVGDGKDALDFIFAKGDYLNRKNYDDPKVIFLDLKMPKLSGIEVLQKIRSSHQKKSIPIVVLTSSKENQDIDACYKYGVNSYIVKPVKFDDYMKTICDVGNYWMSLNQPPRRL